MKAFAEFAQHPVELAAFQQTVWRDATKAWVDAWSGESAAVADKRFRDKAWEEDPISRGLRDAHLAVEGAVVKLLASLPKGSKDHLSVEFYARQFLSALSRRHRPAVARLEADEAFASTASKPKCRAKGAIEARGLSIAVIR